MLLALLTMSLHAAVWNAPYPPGEIRSNTLFSVFSSPPKHLDPVRSYNANEWAFLSQIYEPPLQYNYLKKPYVLEPLTLTQMPQIICLDANGSKVGCKRQNVAVTRYRFTFRSDLAYHSHPAFVKDPDGALRYGNLSAESLEKIHAIDDFPGQKSRKVTASDYAYAIKRMAVRQYHSPILDTMMQYIVGLRDFSQEVTGAAKVRFAKGERLDLRKFDIPGVKVVDDRTLEIRIHGKYPQFLYWMAMNFFAPIPWEADLFYQQKGLKQKNISLDTQPVGSGPYYLAENSPNRRIRLVKNPSFHTERYPGLTAEEANASGVSKQLLRDSGKKLPFIDEAVYSLEKESIPLWNKFLQGYYDASGISSEAFDQAVQIGSGGSMGLSDTMKKKGIRMVSSVEPSIFYMAFNMEDPVVGGYTVKQKKLRQAISIAQDQEEYISIFLNERGVPAQGPIPPGIFGYEEGKKGTNPVVYDWVRGKRVRKSIDVAKKLLAEAGYPGGISAKTGKRLKLYYDTTATGPDDRALMDWRRKQFAKLGIELVIRATDYNRFQEKVRKGKVQLFSWGWNADYPDPENFLFLLYGKNAVIDTDGAGINSANYKNPEFDALFRKMRTMPNSSERLGVIEKMLHIAREDAPWVWGFYPKSLALVHGWFKNVVPNAMANNTLKYKRIDPVQRYEKQQMWNRPVLWPLLMLAAAALLLIWGVRAAYRGRQTSAIRKGEA